MIENPYDAILYATFPWLRSHPDRLATVGTLFGMTPAPVTGCRVLEIGCGDGSNLIPMACELPQSRFTGVDLAEAPIAAGNRTIHALHLDNISLVAADLRNIGSDYGEFDYILAHGVYSWIPADVRDRLMAVCRERLAPQGIAFISYNTYPGRHIHHMLREMLLYHTRNLHEPADRIQQARSFLRFFQENRQLPPEWQPLLDHEGKTLLARRDGGLFHDDLAEINDPVYFRDFAAHAARHGLQYLGEAEIYPMFDTQGTLDWVGPDVLEREQYVDFLRLRQFRQTLLVHEGIAIDRYPTAEMMERFLFSAPAHITAEGQIQGLHGIKITAVHQTVSRLTSALGDAYPLPVTFDDLLPYADDAASLQEILFTLVTSGFADLHVHDFPCEESVTNHPQATPLVRHQAALSPNVTSACHQPVELDEIGRYLVLLLDGTRTHEQIVEALARIPNAPPIEQIREYLPGSLQWMARMALLEA